MKKIVIAIDSFKGCLSSVEAGEAAAEGVRAACPIAEVMVLPVADGGEGMQDVLIAATDGQRIAVRAHSPLMKCARLLMVYPLTDRRLSSKWRASADCLSCRKTGAILCRLPRSERES